MICLTGLGIDNEDVLCVFSGSIDVFLVLDGLASQSGGAYFLGVFRNDLTAF